MSLVPYISLSIPFKESCVPHCHFSRKACWLLTCLNFSNCTLCSVCANMPVIPHAFSPPRHFWVFECFLVSARASTVAAGQDPNLPETLLLFSPFLHLTPCAILTPLLMYLPSSATSTKLNSSWNRQHKEGSPMGSRHSFSLAYEHNWTSGSGQSKAPEHSSNQNLLCALNLPSRDSYKKPFTPRADRCSPRITCGSLLWDL